MPHTVSVIVPIYNVAAFLPRCLDSILAQTFTDFQLILVNDGSPDCCGNICDSYAARDNRITVIHKENGGLSSARNAGLAITEGRFIAFVDSDDWLHPQYLELLLHFQQQGDYDLVICDYQRVSDPVPMATLRTDDIIPQELSPEEIYRQHRTKSYVWNKLYRRELIGNHRFVEHFIPEDAVFNGTVLSTCTQLRACHLPTVLYFYFLRPGSLITQLNPSHRLALTQVYAQLAETTSTPRMKLLYTKELLKAGLVTRYHYSISGGDPEIQTSCRQLLRQGLTLLRRHPDSRLKDRMLYLLLCKSPTVYRIMRIFQDPTLRAWEKQQKSGK